MKRLLILSIILFGISGQAGLKSIPVAKPEKPAFIDRVGGYIGSIFSDDDETEGIDAGEEGINEHLTNTFGPTYLEPEEQNFEIELEADETVSETKTFTCHKLLMTVCTTLQQLASASNQLARAVLVVAR